MIRNLTRAIFLFLAPMIVYAAVPAWELVPAESSLTFTGTQNGAPASGKFKKFDGEINFDPAQLNDSHVKITVDMNSVSTSYSDLVETLLTSDWFDVKVFPTAVFAANHFTKTGTNSFNAEGKLTIRDKTVPVNIAFTEEELSPTKVRVKGSTVLKRTAFNIGTGEWGDLSVVKDDVQVNFVLVAVKK